MSASLQSGTTLGPYRLIAPLGAGGMGEVFKAHDSKLDRAVALKILPADVVRDPERVRRFVQEAKSASSLSHPNIVTIYDIGAAAPVAAGASGPAGDAELHYIAMELVEGSTLRQLFDDRSVEPRTLLAYLAQAAEGLAKAHAVGIVHRDLKPDNIMVTRDGYAKVLDFGLAKLTERGAAGSALTVAPTALQEDNTREGAVMGTIGYMSPEQAQGKPVDHRTDLFAFGCLLYEAATGKRPFTGESNVDVLHAIVREKPVPVEEIAPQAPRALVRTIRRCLAKEPERRYQSMKDLALELHDMVDEWETLATPSGPVSSATALSGAAAPARAGVGRAGWIGLGIGAVALLVAAGMAWRGRAGDEPTSAAARSFQSMQITPLTSSGQVLDAAPSPDGRYLAYLRIDEPGVSLWVRQIATGSDVQILPPRGPDRPLHDLVFTPDGNYLAYLRSTEDPALPSNLWELYQVPVLGGTPRKLVTDIDTAPAHSPDGSRIAFIRQDPGRGERTLLVAAADGSAERPLASSTFTSGAVFVSNRWGVAPAWSPDGERIAVVVQTRGSARSERVALVEVDSARQAPLGAFAGDRISGLSWAPDGRSLYVAASTGTEFAQIWRLAYPDGAASRVTNDLADYAVPRPTADGGSLVAVQGRVSSELWEASLEPPGPARPLRTGTNQLFLDFDHAADGSLVFVLVQGAEEGIWRLPPGADDPVRLTHGLDRVASPRISRDGRTIAFLAADADGELHPFVMNGDGGDLRRLDGTGSDEINVDEVGMSLSPDGTWIAYLTAQRTGIWRLNVAGGPPVLLVDDPVAWSPEISPDGTRLLYCTTRREPDGPGRNVLVVVPAAGGAPLVEIPRPGTLRSPAWLWAADQRSALLVVTEGDGDNVWRLPFDGRPPERVTDFASTHIFGATLLDGDSRLVFSKGEVVSDAVLITDFR